MAESGAELMRTLHDEHAAALWSFVLGLTSGDRGRAEDVVQETLLRAWRRPELMQPDGDGHQNTSIRSWLFTVTANQVRRSLRRLRLREALQGRLRPPADQGEVDPRHTDLATALRGLDLRDRQLVALRYGLGLTSEEIGEQLGLSASGARVRLQRVLTRLRKELSDE